jgi:hypothetical protein
MSLQGPKLPSRDVRSYVANSGKRDMGAQSIPVAIAPERKSTAFRDPQVSRRQAPGDTYRTGPSKSVFPAPEMWIVV